MRKNLLARSIATMIAGFAAAGCGSINQAGTDAYTVRPYANDKGGTSCCELAVTSGKEYAAREVQFSTDGKGGAALRIGETGAKAFKGQALAVKALTVLPVNDLADLLK